MSCGEVPRPGILNQDGWCPASPAQSMQSTYLASPQPRFSRAGLCWGWRGQPSLIYTPKPAFQYNVTFGERSIGTMSATWR